MTKENEPQDSCRILELSDCVLRILFSYLDTTSLYLLTLTCRRFKYFIEDPVFWRYIDARREPNSNDKVAYCCDRIHEKTTRVLFQAKERKCGQVPKNFFDIVCPFKNLSVLALENQRFNGKRLALKDFPKCLEELSLKKTQIKSAEYFFQHSDKSMQNLRVLILDDCNWVTCSFFLSAAKYENLEIVSAVKCPQLHLNMMPYLALARFGCKKLKLFDCRFTEIGHELLHLSRVSVSRECIVALYFQSIKTAEADYNAKILNGFYRHVPASSNEHFDTDTSISDRSLSGYVDIIASDIVETVPDSLLYKDPYPECTCKSKEESFGIPCEEITEDHFTYVPPSQPMKFFCPNHFKMARDLPVELQNFFAAHQTDNYPCNCFSHDSDSDSDAENDTGCCVYGRGKKIVFLTAGNPVTVHQVEQEAGASNNERRHDTYNFGIFKVSSNNASVGSEDSTNRPGTSRDASDNNANETEGRKKTKRKLCDSKCEGSQKKKSKQIYTDENSDVYEARVIEIDRSAAEVGNRIDRALQASMDIMQTMFQRYRRQNQPSTSRSDDAERNTDQKDSSQKQRENPKEGNKGFSGGNQEQNAQSTLNRLNEYEISLPLAEPRDLPSTSQGPNSGTRKEKIAKDSNENERNNTQDSKNVNRIELPKNVNDPNDVVPPPFPPTRGSNYGEVHLRFVRGTRFINPLFANRGDRKAKKVGLRRLSLRGFKKITDCALGYIKNLNIDLLDLTYTSVTKEGIENFLVHNPNCRIIHPLYCVCKPLNPF